MVLKFRQLDLDGIMELKGKIYFPERRLIVLYGTNQQGKTNVINAVRYAFLRELKGFGRRKKEYDEWSLPTREELVFDGEGKISVLFEYNNELYVLHRRILGKRRREELELYPLRSPSQKIDISTFLKNKLKVSLLDALFAPEIIGGFRQLYGGNINKSLGEMFKGITTLRTLVKSFIHRFNRMKIAAKGELKNMEKEYTQFCDEIKEMCPLVLDWKEYKELTAFEADKTTKKIDVFNQRVLKVIGKLEEETLIRDVENIVNKAREYEKIRRLIVEIDKVLSKIDELKNAKFDLKRLRKWVRSVSQIKDIESAVKPPPKFKDKELGRDVAEVLNTLIEAKKNHKEVIKLAKKERVKLENVEEVIKDLSIVESLLRKDIKIEKEAPASITKIEGRVFTVVDAKLLVKDSSLAEISKHPIPKGKPDEKRRSLKSLHSKITKLKNIKKRKRKVEKLFNNFITKDLPKLHQLETELEKNIKKVEKRIKKWSEKLASLSSSFTGKKIEPREFRSHKDVEEFINRINIKISAAENHYLKKINLTLESLGIRQVKELVTRKLQKILKQIKKQIENLPKLKKLEEKLQQQKQAWQEKSEIYLDYAEIPKLTREIVPILEKILHKCFNEQKLREKIASTYAEIIKIMHQRQLIQAVSEITFQDLKGVVKYKGKTISHPAGSEKAFFSLAILTTLAHFFQIPVLIDEVANNLDSKNLKAFFELVREFKDKYGIQYVLSVKETKDFDLETWVKDLRDDIVVYEIQDKHIQQLKL